MVNMFIWVDKNILYAIWANKPVPHDVINWVNDSNNEIDIMGIGHTLKPLFSNFQQDNKWMNVVCVCMRETDRERVYHNS